MSQVPKMRRENNDIILENIIANIPQYIFWKNRDLVYMGSNDNYASLVGLTNCREIVGTSDFELPWQQDGNTATYFRQRDIEVLNGKKIINLEQTLSLPSGKKIVVLLNKSPIMNEHGEIIGVLGVSTDITLRKLREDELFKAKQEAERAISVKNQFLYNIQHDIRTPFNGIITAAEILKTSSNPNLKDELLENIIQSSHSLLGLLNQVIELSHTESGTRPIVEKKFTVEELVKDIISTTKLSAQIKQLDLLVDIASNLPTYLLGDKFRVQCILMNLLNNAVKFTNTGHVKLSIQPVKLNERTIVVQFSVEDTGIGIPKEKYNFIFEKFARLTPAYQGKHQGLGNGLSMVKRFLEDLEGEIDLKSEVNKGTIFSCLVPFKKSLLDE
jgi:two-component system aerobic respiration control sensor histidine kinase ArcB